MLKNWLKIAFINYRKNAMSTIINVLGLSVGICIFLLVFIHWMDERSYESWNPNKDNIYIVENKNSFGFISSSSYPALSVSKEKFDEIEDFTIANSWDFDKIRLIAGERTAYTNVTWAAGSYFDFFPMERIAGNLKNAISDDRKIAISEGTAKALFGDEYKGCIGKMIKMDAQENKEYMVSAVYQFPASRTVFTPGVVLRNKEIDRKDLQWMNYSYIGYFKLKSGTDVKSVEKKLSRQINEQEKKFMIKWNGKYDEKDKTQIFLTPISTMKLEAKVGINKGDKKSIMILLGLSGLILALSMINLINLKTAQASQRAKEVGVRKAIGGSKGQLIVQFLLENLIICSVSFLIAFALVELFLPSYNQFLNKEMVLDDPQILIYSCILLIVFACISGIIPALYLSDFKPIYTLKGNFSRSKHGVWLRNFILTVQLAVSSFFIICSMIIYFQVRHMMNKELGFTGDQVVQIDFKKTDWQNNYTYKKYVRLKAEISNIRGVEAVTGSVNTMGNRIANMAKAKNAKDTTQSVNGVVLGGIDYNYFDFYKMKFVSGRDLDVRKASDTMFGVVANEAFIKKMGWNKNDALGKEVYPGWDKDRKYKILGVIKDFNLSGVEAAVEPMLFFNYDRIWAKNDMKNIQVKLSKENINGTMERIKEFWITKAEPGYPFEYGFVNKKFAKTFEKFEKQRTLFTILNIVVLVVALLGLFALSSLLIDQKLKDVAIKKTLGADGKTIVWEVTKTFLFICILAVFISFPFGYYAMNEWLKDFAYRIEMPWWPYALSLILLLILTFSVVSIKAYKATKVNLVKYLKYE